MCGYYRKRFKESSLLPYEMITFLIYITVFSSSCYAYVAPVPPPANTTAIVTGVLTLQLSWNHPVGYNPGTPLSPSTTNSTLDQYRIYEGTSLTSFSLYTPLTSVYQVESNEISLEYADMC